MATLAEFRTKVASRIKDASSKLGNDEIDAALLGARSEYEQMRPRVVSEEITGADVFDYALPASWADGFSVILSLLYPYSSTERLPAALDPEQYTVFRLAAGLKLRFLEATPATGEKALLVYTAPHTLTSGTVTIPTADDEALADLAAAYACEALAGRYQQTTEPSLAADSVERRSISDGYRSQAGRWRKAYEAKMQEGPARRAAVAMAAIPVRFSDPRVSRRGLFH